MKRLKHILMEKCWECIFKSALYLKTLVLKQFRTFHQWYCRHHVLELKCTLCWILLYTYHHLFLIFLKWVCLIKNYVLVFIPYVLFSSPGGWTQRLTYARLTLRHQAPTSQILTPRCTDLGYGSLKEKHSAFHLCIESLFYGTAKEYFSAWGQWADSESPRNKTVTENRRATGIRALLFSIKAPKDLPKR